MRYEVYRDRKKQWRWRAISRNGRIVADSGEAYTRKKACLNGVDLMRSSSKAKVTEV